MVDSDLFVRCEKLVFSKVPLGGSVVVGGLSSLDQSYKFFFLPSEQELSSKLELAIILSRFGVQREYSSLRFSSLAQFRGFLNNVIRAYVFFGRMKGEVNSFNYGVRMCEVKQFVHDCFMCDPKSLKDYKE